MLNGVIEESVKYVVAPVLTVAAVGLLTYFCCKKDQAKAQNTSSKKSMSERMQTLRDAHYRSEHGMNPAHK